MPSQGCTRGKGPLPHRLFRCMGSGARPAPRRAAPRRSPGAAGGPASPRPQPPRPPPPPHPPPQPAASLRAADRARPPSGSSPAGFGLGGLPPDHDVFLRSHFAGLRPWPALSLASPSVPPSLSAFVFALRRHSARPPAAWQPPALPLDATMPSVTALRRWLVFVGILRLFSGAHLSAAAGWQE